MSIQSQKAILEKYERELGKPLILSMWTMVIQKNFQRPSFQRIIADIEDGRIDIVITKELSCPSWNYLESGA